MTDKQKIKIITYRGKDAPPVDLSPLKNQIEELKGNIESWKNSEELANGLFDAEIKEIENKVSELITEIERVKELDISSLNLLVESLNSKFVSYSTKKELGSLEDKIQRNILDIIELLKTNNQEIEKIKSEIPTIVSDSDNVTVEKRGSEYGISVDIPKLKQIVQGGGLSKTAVQNLIDESLIGYTPGGSVSVSGDYATRTEVAEISSGFRTELNTLGNYVLKTGDTMTGDLIMDNAQINTDQIYYSGSTFTIAGSTFTFDTGSFNVQMHNSGITHSSFGDVAYSSAFNDYFTKTEVVEISGNLQSKIDNIIQEGTVIVGGPGITASQNGMTWTVGLSGTFGDANLRTEVGNVTGYIQGQLDSLDTKFVNVSGDTMTGPLTITEIKAVNVQGLHLKNSNGQAVALLGAGGGQGITFYDGVIVNSLSGHSDHFVTHDSNGRLVDSDISPTSILQLSGNDVSQSSQIAELSGNAISQSSQIANLSANAVSSTLVFSASANAQIQTTNNLSPLIFQVSGANISQASQIAAISATNITQQSQINGLIGLSGSWALDANVVHKTGNETIAGDKTFTGFLNIGNTVAGGKILMTSPTGIVQQADQAITINGSNVNISGSITSPQFLGSSTDGTQLFRGVWNNAVLRVRYVQDGVNGLMLETTNNNETNYGIMTIAASAMKFASSSVTIQGNTVWHAGNDGTGSGLDADLLDGLDATTFTRQTETNNQSTQISQLSGDSANQAYLIAQLSGNSALDINVVHKSGIESIFNSKTFQSGLNIYDPSYGGLNVSNFGFNSLNRTLVIGSTGNTLGSVLPLCFNVDLRDNPGTGYNGDGAEYFFRNVGYFKTPNQTNNGYNTVISWTTSGNVNFSITPTVFGSSPVWHRANDGANSGLDADLLDGQEGTFYITASTDASANAFNQMTVMTRGLTGVLNGNNISQATQISQLSGNSISQASQIASISAQMSTISGGGFSPVIMMRSTNAGQSLSVSRNTIVYEDLDYSTGGGSYAASGAYYVPSAGYYHVSASISPDAVSAATLFSTYIYVNGNEYRSTQCRQVAATSDIRTFNVEGVVYCSAGDYIRVLFYTSSGYNLYSDNNYNRLAIHKVG